MSTLVRATTVHMWRPTPAEHPARWTWDGRYPWLAGLTVDLPGGDRIMALFGRQMLAASLAGVTPILLHRPDVRAWLDTQHHPIRRPVLRIELRAEGHRVTRIATDHTTAAEFLSDTHVQVAMCSTPEHPHREPQCPECEALSGRVDTLLAQALA